MWFYLKCLVRIFPIWMESRKTSSWGRKCKITNDSLGICFTLYMWEQKRLECMFPKIYKRPKNQADDWVLFRIDSLLNLKFYLIMHIIRVISNLYIYICGLLQKMAIGNSCICTYVSLKCDQHFSIKWKSLFPTLLNLIWPGDILWPIECGRIDTMQFLDPGLEISCSCSTPFRTTCNPVKKFGIGSWGQETPGRRDPNNNAPDAQCGCRASDHMASLEAPDNCS